jgi:hypothetical protein
MPAGCITNCPCSPYPSSSPPSLCASNHPLGGRFRSFLGVRRGKGAVAPCRCSGPFPEEEEGLLSRLLSSLPPPPPMKNLDLQSAASLLLLLLLLSGGDGGEEQEEGEEGRAGSRRGGRHQALRSQFGSVCFTLLVWCCFFSSFSFFLPSFPSEYPPPPSRHV